MMGCAPCCQIYIPFLHTAHLVNNGSQSESSTYYTVTFSLSHIISINFTIFLPTWTRGSLQQPINLPKWIGKVWRDKGHLWAVGTYVVGAILVGMG